MRETNGHIDPISYNATLIAEYATTTITLASESNHPSVREAIYHLLSLVKHHHNHLSPEVRALMLMVRAIEISSGFSRWPNLDVR